MGATTCTNRTKRCLGICFSSGLIGPSQGWVEIKSLCCGSYGTQIKERDFFSRDKLRLQTISLLLNIEQLLYPTSFCEELRAPARSDLKHAHNTEHFIVPLGCAITLRIQRRRKRRLELVWISKKRAAPICLTKDSLLPAGIAKLDAEGGNPNSSPRTVRHVAERDAAIDPNMMMSPSAPPDPFAAICTQKGWPIPPRGKASK